MIHWYYALDGQQLGPITAEELAERYRRGDLTGASLVWHSGWPQWRPLSEAAAELGLPPDSPPPPAIPAPTSVANIEPPVQQAVVQAGFWRRFAAIFLDNLILSTGFYGALFAIVLIGALSSGLNALASNEPPAWLTGTFLFLALLYYPLAGLYYSLQESGPHQATLGKRALGIKVCDNQGRRLTFGHALGRWMAALLSYLTLYIGFLMAAFTGRKQALHDLIAGTQVTDRWAYTDQTQRQQQSTSGCLVAVVVAAIGFGGVFALGILAAIAIPAYQEYTVRVQVAEVIQRASPAKLAVAEFFTNTDRCPHDWQELGMPPLSGQALGSAQLGESGSGQCVITLVLGTVKGMPNSDGLRIWLTREADNRWTCDAEVASKYLPAACR